MLPVVTELTDGSVLLRPWRLQEAGWYAAQVLDPQIQAQTTEPADLTEQQVRDAITASAADPHHHGWVICAADTGQLLGNAALDLAAGTVSYWVAAAARGRGAATAAVRLMATYAFTTSDLALLRLWVTAGNHASARVAEKTGFVRTPELDDTIDVRGQPWTAHYYTLRRPHPAG
jgi:[ribosomal protein S5]-alanine N-acetyltransferase